ncbi:helix-turn-helix domain-containing protein, partial [Thermobifida halotolerans]|uniref:helix-turn-helix domain-containing protein n=1 Tax=Thermobifida halotolerans TaxID=483545 RepID=UPI001F309675
MRLRYSFRLYPSAGQRAALARASGCARVVFSDALRVREEARATGAAVPRLGGTVPTSHSREEDPATGLARRGPGAPAVPAGPGHGVPELLRRPQRQTPQDGASPVQVPQGRPAVDPFHRERLVADHDRRGAAPA